MLFITKNYLSSYCISLFKCYFAKFREILFLAFYFRTNDGSAQPLLWSYSAQVYRVWYSSVVEQWARYSEVAATRSGDSCIVGHPIVHICIVAGSEKKNVHEKTKYFNTIELFFIQNITMRMVSFFSFKYSGIKLHCYEDLLF